MCFRVRLSGIYVFMVDTASELVFVKQVATHFSGF